MRLPGFCLLFCWEGIAVGVCLFGTSSPVAEDTRFVFAMHDLVCLTAHTPCLNGDRSTHLRDARQLASNKSSPMRLCMTSIQGLPRGNAQACNHSIRVQHFTRARTNKYPASFARPQRQ